MTMVDTHAHYDHRQFAEDRNELLAKLPERGVEAVVNVGSALETSLASIHLAKKHSHFHATVGVHPHYTLSFEAGHKEGWKDEEGESVGPVTIERLSELACDPVVVAFGEIGLDFHHNFSPPDVQRKWFGKQLGLAISLGKPVVIHSREADREVFDIIKASSARNGVIHSFSGDAELAMEYIGLGFLVGVGGVVTFKNAFKLKEAVAKVPLDRILLETDCPYLAPHPNRGKRNDSTMLVYVAGEIARIKEVPLETVYQRTKESAKRLFNI